MSSSHSPPAESTVAASGVTRAASGTGPPRLASVLGSAPVSTPRWVSSAYTEPCPAKTSRPACAPGIGVTGAVVSNVAPSTRRTDPADRSTA